MGRAWRCFGSNHRIDPEAVMDDLTLDRMQIKPIGRESVNRSFSEHRVIPPVADPSEEAAATHADGAISVAACEQTSTPVCTENLIRIFGVTDDKCAGQT